MSSDDKIPDLSEELRGMIQRIPPGTIKHDEPVEFPKAPAGTGETIAVLAIGTQDGHEMRKAIGEVKPGAKVVVVTELRQIEGVRATEFVMTGPFRSQRSIRLLLAAEAATRRTRLVAQSTPLQDGD